MAIVNATHADLEAWEKRYGHPGHDLPLVIRQAYAIAGRDIPQVRQGLVVLTPPTPGTKSGKGGCCDAPGVNHGGHCHVCGAPTDADSFPAAHAVARFEETPSPRSGEPMRMLVNHCKEHAPQWNDNAFNHPACRRDTVTPGSGLEILDVEVGGFCEPVDRVLDLGMDFFPGARQLGTFIKYAVAASGLLLVSLAALQHSEGQMKSTLKGDTGAMGAQGDSTSGHGYNLGDILILSGGAPADADTLQSGTLGIDWVLPNPAFGAPSSALPAVLTLNAVTNVAAAASITAGYGRMVTNASTGVPTPEDGTLSTTQRRVQFSVGTSGADMIFNTLVIVVAGTCSLTSLTYTHPA